MPKRKKNKKQKTAHTILPEQNEEHLEEEYVEEESLPSSRLKFPEMSIDSQLSSIFSNSFPSNSLTSLNTKPIFSSPLISSEKMEVDEKEEEEEEETTLSKFFPTKSFNKTKQKNNNSAHWAPKVERNITDAVLNNNNNNSSWSPSFQMRSSTAPQKTQTNPAPEIIRAAPEAYEELLGLFKQYLKSESNVNIRERFLNSIAQSNPEIYQQLLDYDENDEITEIVLK